MRVCAQKTEKYSSYPVYHSVYETFEVVEKFYDPTFRRLLAVAQVRGALIFSLADSQLLPLDATQYADSLGKYTKSITQLAQSHSEEMEAYKVTFGELSSVTVCSGCINIMRRDPNIFAYVVVFLSVPPDSLFSSVENFTIAARDFHQRLQTINRAEYV